MSGIDRQRREDRVNPVHEHAPHTLAFRLVEVVEAPHDDAELLGKARPQVLLPHLREASSHRADAGPHQIQLLRGVSTVQGWLDDPRAEDALQAADPLHDEFVEVVLGDGEETKALEERRALVHGLVQHPPVEVEPTQLGVEIERWMAVGGGRRHGSLARREREQDLAADAMPEARLV